MAEASLLEPLADKHPEVIVASSLYSSGGTTDAALAELWSTTYGFEDAQVWADPAKIIKERFSYATDGYFPFSLLVDLETMTLTHLGFGSPNSTVIVHGIRDILEAEHPCFNAK